jgi:hypothetical protein
MSGTTVKYAQQQPSGNNFVSKAWVDNYQQSGLGRLTILSGSMAPLISTGDRIIVRKTPLNHIRIGDIITFWKGDVLVTHRVVRKCIKDNALCFIESGDSSARTSLCRGQSVLGRVALIKKGQRTINLDRFQWKACNRAAGVMLFCALAVRVLGRKTPWIPRWFRASLQGVYGAACRFSNTFFHHMLFRSSGAALPLSAGRPLDSKTYRCANVSFANGTAIEVFIPHTDGLKLMGLSATRPLAENQGMLFVYESDDFWGIWMKDMHYPIDIIWLDESLRIVHIEQGVDPSTYPRVFAPPVPARYILEVASGVAEKNNLRLRDSVFCDVPLDNPDRFVPG